MLVKRSIAISGHRTSLALEPQFWQALEDEAAARDMSLAQLVAHIDKSRHAGAEKASLASALRVWLLARYREPI